MYRQRRGKCKSQRFLTPDCTISWGGSQTLSEIGLLDDLKESDDYIIYDRAEAKTPEEKESFMER